VFAAVGVSLIIAVVVSILALLVSVPAARALAWYEFPGKRALLFMLLLPVLAPPLAAAMGVHGLFLRYGSRKPPPAVILVHLIQGVPYAILMLAGSFSRLDRISKRRRGRWGLRPSPCCDTSRCRRLRLG